jgi:hypothetical protein
MTVRIEKPALNLREEINRLDKPTGIAGEAMLRAETPQEQFNLIGAGRRNLIINGAMQVAQRGTSAVTAQDGFPVDRMRIISNTTDFSATQSSTVPPNSTFRHSLKVDCTTVKGTINSSTYAGIIYLIEGFDASSLMWGTPNAQPITVSFWVRSNITGTYYWGTKNSVANRAFSKAYTIEAADTWEYKSFTIPGDVTGSWITDNGQGLSSDFWLAGANTAIATQDTWYGGNINMGTDQVNLFDNTANEWYLTGVQIEVGKVATPFEHRSYGEELALCQRYYQLFEAAACHASSTTAVEFTYQWNTEMRAAPSVSASAALIVERHNITIYTQSSAAVSATQTTPIAAKFTLPNLSGLTAGNAYSYIGNHSSSGHIELSAEL